MSLISRSRWLTRTLVALTFALLFVLSTSARAFAANLTQISSDPFTNSTSQHQTEVEPDTFSFGKTIVSAFQVGRFFNGGASDIGFATSINGGHSFTNGFLPGTTVFATPAGVYARASDPSVAFDAKHGVWIISFLGLRNPFPPVDVLVSRSTNGGLTWSNPVVVNADGHFNDKNWTVCDNTASSPFFGNCYTEFDDNTLHDLIQMSTSTDGGQTWGAAQSTANGAHGIGGQPLVQPNGTVIVPIEAVPSPKILAFTSTNGGASWNSTVIAATIKEHPVAANLRTSPLPSAEIDGAGKVYVVWQDCRFENGCKANDIVLSTSTDGATWSAVQRIPADPVGSGVDHFIPGIAVDKSTSGSTAHIGLAFYFYPVADCTTSTCQLDVGFVSSTDGGNAWSAKIQLAGPMNVTWLANTTQGFMVGDYISTSFPGGNAFPVFAVATAPSGGVFNEAMFTVSGGLGITGGQLTSNGDQVVVSQDAMPSIPAIIN
jgi:hypothetical protein